MKKKLLKKFLIVFFLLLSQENSAFGKNNSVIITVGNHPITRLDLGKEIKFIAILSDIKVNENNKKELKDIAIQSLVKRAIKKNEIERLKIEKYNSKDLNNQITNIAKKLGFDIDGLKNFLEQNNLQYKDLVARFEIDLKWNSAIFKLYNKKVSINTLEIEDKINSEIERFKSEKLILLSEIQVSLSNENLETTSNKILSEIEQNGFEDTAKKFSISPTAIKGGSIGWINEKKLSKQIYQNIKNLKVGDISKPILVGDVVVFIKKIAEKITDYNLEIIKRNVVEEEKMKKLEMYSNSHYSDLEKRIKVKFL